jgi:hypothetical protein
MEVEVLVQQGLEHKPINPWTMEALESVQRMKVSMGS